jgi:hypothetical protein
MILIDQPQYTLNVSPVITGNVLGILFIASLFSNIVTDLKTIIVLLKEVIITYIPIYYFTTRKQLTELITLFISIFKADLLQSKLCVVRC